MEDTKVPTHEHRTFGGFPPTTAAKRWKKKNKNKNKNKKKQQYRCLMTESSLGSLEGRICRVCVVPIALWLVFLSFLIFPYLHAECIPYYSVQSNPPPPPTCYLMISDKHPSCPPPISHPPKLPPMFNCSTSSTFFPPFSCYIIKVIKVLPRSRSPDSYRLPSCSASPDVIGSASLYSLLLLLAASDTMTSLILTALLTFSHLGLPPPQCFSERWGFQAQRAPLTSLLLNCFSNVTPEKKLKTCPRHLRPTFQLFYVCLNYNGGPFIQ